MLKPIKNNSLVTERDLKKYADDSMSLTLWLDEKSGILAFELVFDLLIDEWAFICHANGKRRYVRIDPSSRRNGRPQKQTILEEDFEMPYSRIMKFSQESEQIANQERKFVLSALEDFFHAKL